MYKFLSKGSDNKIKGIKATSYLLVGFSLGQEPNEAQVHGW